VTPRIPRPREELRVFTQYGARQTADAIRLNANEWPEATPAGSYVTQAELDRIVLNRYPGAAAEIRQILSKQYGVQPEQLFFGNGSNDTIMQLFLVFGGHGRTTLLFQPTYNLHGRFTVMAGGTLASEMVGLPYRVERQRALEAAARVRPDIVCFCTPNNPTGTLIDDDVILAVAGQHPETLVLVDEAYSDIPGRTLLPALADHPNIVISKTFSKVHAAAGLRFGILVMHPALAEQMRAVAVSFNVGVLTYAVAAKIARDEAAVSERIAFVRRERERVFAEMRRVPGIEPFPSEANFILFRVGGDTAAAQQRFLQHGVAIRDMSPWTGCEGCLRVSIGTREENDRFLAALSAVFAPTPA
jgi:histidinol-phosphate aminotransferase